MSNFLWVKTEKRQKLLDSLESIPEYGKKSKSEMIEIALEEFIKKHGESNNPQTQLTGFKSDGILAVPNFYEANDNPEMWKKFYQKIKSKEEYRQLDNALNYIIGLHNRKLNEL
ncbi:MAG: hypothetical protein VW518_08070 [Burkholderiaceae bacterium]|jgi:hypothetical protein